MVTRMKVYVLMLYGFLHLANAGSNLRTSFEPFRTLTNQFLRTVQPNISAMNITSSLLVTLNNQSSNNLTPMDYVNLYWQPYVGYIILLILGVLFLILFPLVGLCFCCCRICCRRCGAQTNVQAKRNMKRQRIAFNICLFIFSSMILIGAIVAMASNFIFLESVKLSNQTDDLGGNFLYNLNSATVSFSGFINTVTRNLMVHSVEIIRAFIKEALTIFTPVIDTFISTFTSEIKFNDLNTSTQSFIKSYVDLQSLANNIITTASQHQNAANNFTTSLDEIRTQLTSILSNDTCLNITSCPGVRNQLQNLVVGFNVSNINYTNDMSASKLFGNYSISDLQTSLNTTVNTVANISNNAKANFTNFLNNFINQLNGSNLISHFQNFINTSVQPLSKLLDSFQTSLLSTQILSFGTIGSGGLYTLMSYVFYGLCVIISLIFLVVLLFYIGLCYGMCGAPDFEDAARCNKGKGSGFLMAGVAISFIFGWLIMLITMAMFFPGGLFQTEVCSYLNTTNPDQIKTVDDFISFATQKNPIVIGNITLPNLNYYQSIATRCPTSPDLLSAFQLPKEFIQNLVTMIYKTYVEGPINATIADINNYTVQSIDTKGLDDSLKNMTDLNIKIQQVVSIPTQTELKKPITLLPSLPIFVSNLTSLITELKAKNRNDSAAKVSDIALNLNRTILAMTPIHTKYAADKAVFDSAIRNFDSSLNNVKRNLDRFKSQPNNAKNSAVLASQNLLRQTAQNSVNTTLYKVILSIGDCKEMSTSFTKAVNTGCVTLLSSFNNIWMGIGWFLLFIIPAIIFAVKLGDLYRISHIEPSSSAYNHAYMSSNQFLTRECLEMIRRPQRA